MSIRKVLKRITLALFILGSVAAQAWACSAQARVIAISPQPAAAGAEMLVEGDSVFPGAQVEIRWDDVTGNKLGEATADARGSFAATVQIPEATQDVHFIVVTAPGSAIARAAVEITNVPLPDGTGAPRASTTTAQLWSGFSSDGVTSPPGDDVAGARSVPGPSRSYLAGIALLAAGAGALATVGVTRTKRRLSPSH